MDISRVLENLAEDDAELYGDLVENLYAEGVRLEQEQIDYRFMLSRFEAISR